MGKYFLNAPQPEVNATDALVAEMVLDKILYDARKERILKEIDHALQDNDKKEFMRLTDVLKSF